MFKKFASVVIKFRWPVLALWALLVVGLLVIKPSGTPPENLSSKVTENQRAGRIINQEFPVQAKQDNRAQAYVILTNPNGITDSDIKVLSDLGTWLQLPPEQGGPGKVADVISPANPLARTQLLSKDKQAGLVVINFTFRSTDDIVFETINKHLDQIKPAGTTLELTGQPVIISAQNQILAGILGDGISPAMAASLILVLLILGMVYRSPLAVLVPLVSIGIVALVALQVVNWGKYGGWLPTSEFTTEFVTVVLFGAGTNYCLFLLSRYREELQHGLPPREAIVVTLAAVGEAISSSAATVVAAMAVMGLAQSNILRSIGPAVGLSVAIMLLAGLTLIPALLSLIGRALFWPWKIKTHEEAGRTVEESYGIWSKVGNLVVRRPVQVMLGCVIVLLPLAILASQVEPSYNDLRTLPADNPAVSGIERLQKHFGGGVEQITLVVYDPKLDLSSPENSAGINKLLESAKTLPETKQTGSIQLSDSKHAARITLTLGIETDSIPAQQTITRLDNTLRQAQGTTPLAGSEVVLRGDSVASRDAAQIFGDDFGLMILLVSIIIYIILAVLVRSLSAPLYLLITIALSTATSVGLTYLIFHIWRGEDIHFSVPIFAFVFLVALGEDFNILLMSRVREETQRRGITAGIARAVASTGGTLTSCGLIMAGTFSIFSLNPLTILHQLGFAVMAGVLMDTFIVRCLLVPSIVKLLGRWNWVGVRGPVKLSAEITPETSAGVKAA
jgi:RND superfamily putative drug exporter